MNGSPSVSCRSSPFRIAPIAKPHFPPVTCSGPRSHLALPQSPAPTFQQHSKVSTPWQGQEMGQGQERRQQSQRLPTVIAKYVFADSVLLCVLRGTRLNYPGTYPGIDPGIYPGMRFTDWRHFRSLFQHSNMRKLSPKARGKTSQHPNAKPHGMAGEYLKHSVTREDFTTR